MQEERQFHKLDLQIRQSWPLLWPLFYIFFWQKGNRVEGLSSLSLLNTMSQVKKTQTSRKGKKAWRKNIDITEVEEAQEQIRATERAM